MSEGWADFTDRELERIERTTQEIGREILDRRQRPPTSSSGAGGTTASWPGPWPTSRSRCRCSASSTCCRCSRRATRSSGTCTNTSTRSNEHLPAAVRLGLRSPSPPTRVAGRAVAIAARRNAQSHARRFIAGTNVGRSPGRREARTQAHVAPSRSTCSAKRSPARAKPIVTCKSYLDLIERHRRRRSTPGPRCPQIDRSESRAAAAGQRLGQALGPRQPVRPDRLSPARPSAWRGRLRELLRSGAEQSARSSMSTWSRTRRRT